MGAPGGSSGGGGGCGTNSSGGGGRLATGGRITAWLRATVTCTCPPVWGNTGSDTTALHVERPEASAAAHCTVRVLMLPNWSTTGMLKVGRSPGSRNGCAGPTTPCTVKPPVPLLRVNCTQLSVLVVGHGPSTTLPISTMGPPAAGSPTVVRLA